MRRVFVVVVLLAAVVVGLGVYLDWFRVTTGGTGDSGKMHVDLTIDKDKMKADAEEAKERAKSLGSKATGSATPASPAESTGR